MANNSLEELSTFLNQQFYRIETIDEHLSKATALIQVACQHDFSDFPEKTIHDYLWALREHLERAYRYNFSLLEASLQFKKSIIFSVDNEIGESGVI